MHNLESFLREHSMSVKEFELFHGAVLTKLVRGERSVVLTLIETRQDDGWAVYLLNDEVNFYIKHSTSPRRLIRGNGGYSWTFTFNLEHLDKIRSLAKLNPICLVLVCGQKNIKEGRMEVCFLEPNELLKVIDLDHGDSKSVTVRYTLDSRKLRIFQDRKEIHSVFLNALDNYKIPGR
jgi:hypothetical protein